MDPLTGALTRGQLFAQLDAEFAQQRPVVLLVADVDRCLHMNGSLGFERVDEYLRDVARLFALTSGRAVYRLGGDEFVVLFDDLSVAQHVAEQLRAAAEANFSCLGEEVRAKAIGAGIAQPIGPVATLSFGISIASTTRELLQRADEAWGQAKNRGRNCVTTYERSQPFIR
jgi:diguanylate cyclase (GGDEF)-like protein